MSWKGTIAALAMPVVFGTLQALAQMVPVTDPAAVEEPPASYASNTTHPLTNAFMSSSAEAIGGVQLSPPPPRHQQPHFRPFSTIALAPTGGTLGTGIDLATPLSSSLNLRTGGTYFNLQYPFTIDGVGYNAGLKLTSGKGLIEWYPHHGGFHISAGALYLKSAVSAVATVEAGKQFKLGGTTYLNSVDDPVQGTASLNFPRKLAPLVLLGFGNMIPRSGRHISVPLEIGGAYLRPPRVGLQLAGTACTTQGCFNAATDPTVLANLTQEVDKLNRDIRPLQIYPVVSLGLALRF